MSKHTPGPWRAAATMSSDLHFIRSIESDDAGMIAKVRVGPVLEQDEALANAHLIAAAPELLAALQAMVPLLNSSAGQRYRKAAFAAIVKATGG